MGVFAQGPQLPQTGLLLKINGELKLKSVGSETNFETHQLEIFWLKDTASLNIKFIVFTLLTSHSPIG